MKVGFVGLGIMGRPMAGHLLAGGHEVAVYDIKAVPSDITDAGGVACDTAKAVAEQMLRTIDQAEQGGAALDDDGLDYDVPACP